MRAQCGVALSLNRGVAVVALDGEWSNATERLMSDTIQRLADAGHLEIVVNLSRVSMGSPMFGGCLESLDRIAAAVRERRGRLDAVGSMEQLDVTLRGGA